MKNQATSKCFGAPSPLQIDGVFFDADRYALHRARMVCDTDVTAQQLPSAQDCHTEPSSSAGSGSGLLGYGLELI